MSTPTPPPVGGVPAAEVNQTPGLLPAPPFNPATGMPFPPAPLAPKKLNVLALVAMIVAVVGFLFACIPGALIVGWVLLPIAFVLSIVSLFLKGDKKWMGVVGLIVAVIGTIVGFVVFFAVVATSFNDAFGNGETTVTQPKDDGKDAPADEPAADVAEGTRENPYPLQSTVSNDDWTVVVNSYTADGNATVAAGNQFNEAAPAGSHYEIVNYTVTYKGADSSYAAEVGVALVTSGGKVINTFDSFVTLADSMGLDELYKDGTATGSEAFLVPDGETVLIRLRPGIVADEVFVKP